MRRIADAKDMTTILDALADAHLLGALPAFRNLKTWSAWQAFLAGRLQIIAGERSTLFPTDVVSRLKLRSARRFQRDVELTHERWRLGCRRTSSMFALRTSGSLAATALVPCLPYCLPASTPRGTATAP
jgi:hypothetical protein